jgi:uncharacterized protein with HEPN domain
MEINLLKIRYPTIPCLKIIIMRSYLIYMYVFSGKIWSFSYRKIHPVKGMGIEKNINEICFPFSLQ